MSVECSNTNDCTLGKACFNSKCVNPCSVPKVCGKNTDCSIQNDAAVCNCKAGFTGTPNLGCTPIIYCASNSQCPTTTKCNNGICTREWPKYKIDKAIIIYYHFLCTVECNLARDCVGNELCIGGICQPTCHGNTSCPEFQYCQNNICIQELRCLDNNNCENTQICKTNTIGQVPVLKITL